MNISAKKNSNSPAMRLMRGLIVTIGLMLTVLSLEAAVLPAGSKPYGKTYGQWSAAWWQWALSQPVAGHPFVDDPSFNVATGQSGSVWFLATPFGTVERQIRVPAGKSLLIGMLNTEASDLESLGATEAERRNTANFLANHIVNSSCTINGVAISNLNSYRVTSPEFNFEAPSPWIFGATGGAGVTVSDGYFVMLTPISAGSLTIHITGAFHFSVQEGDPFDFDAAADVTYHVTAH